MAAFPRTHLPKANTDIDLPSALMARSRSGKIVRRSRGNAGFSWMEQFLLNVQNDDDRLLLSIIRQYVREGTTFTILHRDYLTEKGTGVESSNAEVNGASQTGSSIITDGWGNSQTVLKAGDLVQFGSALQVHQLTADATTNGSGQVTLAISPPILAGNSPGEDNDVVFGSAVAFTAVIGGPVKMPKTDANNFGMVAVEFIEAL